jgi:hypothetical protein
MTTMVAEKMERSALNNDIHCLEFDCPELKRMTIMMGGIGMNRYERFARVKRQKLLFAKIRAELKVFEGMETEVNRRAERDA